MLACGSFLTTTAFLCAQGAYARASPRSCYCGILRLLLSISNRETSLTRRRYTSILRIKTRAELTRGIRTTTCTKLHEALWLLVGSALEGRCNLPNTIRAIHGTHIYRRCGNNYYTRATARKRCSTGRRSKPASLSHVSE